MSNIEKPIITQSNPSSTQANALVGAVSAMHLAEPLPEAERERLRKATNRVTVPFLEAAINAAAANGGSVSGVTIDIAQARETLAFLNESQVTMTAARAVLVSIGDERLRRKAELADRAMAIFTALGVQQRLPEGRAMLSHLRAMRAALPRRRRPKVVEPATPSAPGGVTG